MTTWMPRCPRCDGVRVEQETRDGLYGRRVHVVRCCDCGQQQATELRPADRLEPGTEDYARAWREEPGRIVAQLAPGEKEDPEKNPLHPFASSVAPGEPLPRIDRSAIWRFPRR